MLAKTFDWSRMTGLEISGDTVQKRKMACKELKDKLLTEKGYQFLKTCIAISINQVNETPVAKNTVKTITAIVCKHEPTVPSGFSENALVLQACCLIALGEILSSYKGRGDTCAVTAAALLQASHKNRDRSTDHFFAKAQHEFQDLVDETTEKVAATCRERTLLGNFIENLEEQEQPADIANFWQETWPSVLESLRAVDSNQIADREELQILAWLVKGFCGFNNVPIEGLNLGPAILGCADEFGKIILCPPNVAIRQCLSSMLSKTGRTPELKKSFTLEKLVASIPLELFAKIEYSDEANKAIDEGPSFQPCSWLFQRIANSGSNTGWEKEFGTKTGWQSTKKLTGYQWADQILLEAIARRTLEEC